MTEIKIVELSADEKKEAKTLIGRMTKAQRGYLDLGRALQEFSEKTLYRETHKNIEEWANDEMDLSARRVQQLIRAARVCTMLEMEGYSWKSAKKPLPQNEGTCRELAVFLDDDNFNLPEGKLGVDLMVDCWSTMLSSTAAKNKTLKEAGHKPVRLTAANLKKFRVEAYPTLVEAKRKADREEAARKKADEEKKAQGPGQEEIKNEMNESGTEGLEHATPEVTGKTAELLESAQAELAEARDAQAAMESTIRSMRTETRKAKEEAKAAAKMGDSLFIRVALAEGMAACIKAAAERGDTKLVELYRDEMLKVDKQFKTANLSVEDLFKPC